MAILTKRGIIMMSITAPVFITAAVVVPIVIVLEHKKSLDPLPPNAYIVITKNYEYLKHYSYNTSDNTPSKQLVAYKEYKIWWYNKWSKTNEKN